MRRKHFGEGEGFQLMSEGPESGARGKLRKKGKKNPMLQGRRQNKCGLKRHYKEMRREPDNVGEEEGNSQAQLGE